jgi:CBS domain-containing protein
VARELDPDSTSLSEVMTADPDTVGPNDLASLALERMRTSGYRHVPVVENGAVVGIVSLRDLYAAAKSELEEDLQQRDAFIFDTGYGTG